MLGQVNRQTKLDAWLQKLEQRWIIIKGPLILDRLAKSIEAVSVAVELGFVAVGILPVKPIDHRVLQVREMGLVADSDPTPDLLVKAFERDLEQVIALRAVDIIKIAFTVP